MDMEERGIYPFRNGYIDGITIVNVEGEILFSAKFNAKLSNPDEYHEIVGRRLLDVYTNLTPETSTLYRAMQSGSPIYIEDQYLERAQKQGIYTSSTSIPIYSGERIVGAIELSCQQGGKEQEARYEISLDEDNFRTGKIEKLTRQAEEPAYRYDDIIAVNDNMKRAKEYIKTISCCDLPVLLAGETGTGKEMFAQVIHGMSARSGRMFLSQNCAAVPEALMEKTLFGSPPNPESGMPESKGILEIASGGTVFLEEIDSLPYTLQYKLLQALRRGSIPAEGGMPERPVDARLIVSLNSSPENCLENGTLRKDVFYALGKLSVTIPPLRERREDIPVFAEHYVRKYNRVFRKNIRYISKKLVAKLQAYDWPGNSGELEQVVIYGLSIVSDKRETLRLSDFESRYPFLAGDNSTEQEEETVSLYQKTSRFERKTILEAFLDAGGNISETAKSLDIPRQTLQRKLKQYHIR